MPASNFIEKVTLEQWLKGKAPGSTPTKAYLALTEKEIKKTYNGKEVFEAGKGDELSYENYSRTEIKLEATTWKETAGGEATATKFTNEAAINLPKNEGVIGKNVAKYFALCEKAKGSETGEVYFTGKLTEELTITKSITKLEIEAGKLEISCE